MVWSFYLSSAPPQTYQEEILEAESLESKERTQQSLGRDCWVLSPSRQDPDPVTEQHGLGLPRGFFMSTVVTWGQASGKVQRGGPNS